MSEDSFLYQLIPTKETSRQKIIWMPRIQSTNRFIFSSTIDCLLRPYLAFIINLDSLPVYATMPVIHSVFLSTEPLRSS